MVVVRTRELREGCVLDVMMESSRFREGWYNRLDLEISADNRLEASLAFGDNIFAQMSGAVCAVVQLNETIGSHRW